jgi:chitodextrinase
MQWNWGLDDYNAPVLRPALSNAAAQQMTRNVLARFLAPVVPLPSPTSQNDDFDDNTRDTARWTFGTIQGAIYSGSYAWDGAIPVLEQSGRLSISPRANVSGDHYNGYVSAFAWDLTNANVSVEVVQVAGGGTTDTQMALCVDAQNFYMMLVEGGQLYFEQVVGRVRSSTSVAYSATAHRFWRIRHDAAGDTMVFETSADRVTWTTQRSVARQLAITALKVELSAGTWQAVSTPGTAIFDSFRLEANGETAPNQSPVANAGGPYSGITGQAVAFNGAGSSDPDGTLAGYQWSFGDGTTGSGATPAHAYSAAGTYTVTLTVTDNGGATGSTTTTATIGTAPISGGSGRFLPPGRR